MKYLKLINEEFPKPRKSYSASELEEKIKDLEEQIENCDVISHETFDWKEIDEDVVKKWKKSVEALGGYLTKINTKVNPQIDKVNSKVNL